MVAAPRSGCRLRGTQRHALRVPPDGKREDLPMEGPVGDEGCVQFAARQLFAGARGASHHVPVRAVVQHGVFGPARPPRRSRPA